jgi:hypothetical protein
MAGTFANGATLRLGTSTVSEITSISGPDFSADELDTTTHNATDRFRTFEKGLIDAGEISIDGLVNYTELAILQAAMITTSSYSATVTLPTKPSLTRWTATVFLTGLETEAPHDGLIEFSSTMKISGRPTLSQV